MIFDKKSMYIVLTVFFSGLAMSLVDGIVQPTYFVKSMIKIILFLGVPFLYFLFNKKELMYFIRVFKIRNVWKALILGLVVFLVILCGYFLLRDFIAFDLIIDHLVSTIGVNADNFLWIAIYISFMNSLLEEFFFRGFAFLLLKKRTHRWFAYIFSAGLFSLYHVGMTLGWFHPFIYLLALLGLFVGGCIFDYLDERYDTIFISWFVHMCANCAINMVGCIMFGIL